jgi:hypothetical protein
MTSTQIVLLALVVIVVIAVAIAAGMAARRAALRRRFGPEYDRAVQEHEGRMAADRELLRRERRHHELQLRTIAPAERDRFIQRWQVVQAMFVDNPAGAVVAGDELVTELVRDRGYPTGDWEDQSALLSVEHARTLGSYRDAHDIFLKAQRGRATTEDLRQALVHYRDLFADILGVRPDDGQLPAATVSGQPADSRTVSTSEAPGIRPHDERDRRGDEDRRIRPNDGRPGDPRDVRSDDARQPSMEEVRKR